MQLKEKSGSHRLGRQFCDSHSTTNLVLKADFTYQNLKNVGQFDHRFYVHLIPIKSQRNNDSNQIIMQLLYYFTFRAFSRSFYPEQLNNYVGKTISTFVRKR